MRKHRVSEAEQGTYGDLLQALLGLALRFTFAVLLIKHDESDMNGSTITLSYFALT